MIDPRQRLATLLSRAEQYVKTDVGRYADEFDAVRSQFRAQVLSALVHYMQSEQAVTSFKNQIRRAIVEAHPGAFYGGYADAGGEDTTDDDERWLTTEINKQLKFVDYLFVGLRGERETGQPSDLEGHAEAWANALDSTYSEGKLRGNGNMMLTFDGEDGAVAPCAECKKYKGKRHSAAWWLERDLIRRNGNDNFTCGRWENCHHDLYTDKGELWTR